ncbi:hypothetical protein FKP32DRAFT_1674632 [Trametes sanguinea]|nr:hypothetical protein FKP32DRAFT_1674632 [Trametes sanguinea]
MKVSQKTKGRPAVPKGDGTEAEAGEEFYEEDAEGSSCTPTPVLDSSPGLWGENVTVQEHAEALGLRLRRLPSEGEAGGVVSSALPAAEDLDTMSISGPPSPNTPTRAPMALSLPLPSVSRARQLRTPELQTAPTATAGLLTQQHIARTRKRVRVDSPPENVSTASYFVPTSAGAASARSWKVADASHASTSAVHDHPPPYAVTRAVPDGSTFLANPGAYPEYHQLISDLIDLRQSAVLSLKPGDPGISRSAVQTVPTPAAADPPLPPPEYCPPVLQEQNLPQFIRPRDMHIRGTAPVGDDVYLGSSGSGLAGRAIRVAHGAAYVTQSAAAPNPALASSKPDPGLMDTQRWSESAGLNPWLASLTAEEKASAVEPTLAEVQVRSGRLSAGGRVVHSAVSVGKQAVRGLSGWLNTEQAATSASSSSPMPVASSSQNDPSSRPDERYVPSGMPRELPPPPSVKPASAPLSASGVNRAEYSRARYLQETQLLPVTLEPQGGFPHTHSRDPYDLTRNIPPTRYEQWVKGDPATRCIIEIYGFVDYANQDAVNNLIALLKDVIATITGETTAVFYIPHNPRPVDGDEDGEWGTALLVEGLSETAVSLLAAYRVWSTPGVTFFVHRHARHVPEFLVGFGGLTGTNEAATRDEIRDFFRTPSVKQHLTQILFADGVPLKYLDVVADKIIRNLRIDLVPGSASAGTNYGFAANVYSSPPPTWTPDRWQEWKACIVATDVELPSNPAAFIREPERCEGCHAADHTTPSCPFPSIPGWLGVLRTRRSMGLKRGNGGRGGRGGGGPNHGQGRGQRGLARGRGRGGYDDAMAPPPGRGFRGARTQWGGGWY